MIAVRGVQGASALTIAARFAAGGSSPHLTDNAPSCVPLLLLLRRVTVEPEPSDAHQAHMTLVMEALCQGPPEDEEEKMEEPVSLFDVDYPDDARDECVHLLLEQGAGGFDSHSPVMRRIIRERFALARAPQLINEAVVGMVLARQQVSRP
ncbi:hypothetical protein FOA52_010607 [Chlamydomonas sp. UWO 241]|nr:hypothetical protein FOA52_010607 [Chlamydomonas sp. UWO 241]